MEQNEIGLIDRAALFSAETEDWRIPMEPDPDEEVTLCMRTARDNAEHVYYVEDGAEVEMEKAFSDQLFDYYEYVLQ